MIRIRQIKVPIENNNIEEIKAKVASKIKIKQEEIQDLKIIKKSIDARRKNQILYIYEVDIQVSKENEILKNNRSKDILMTPIEQYIFPKKGIIKLNKRPIIVGSGPAGLFSAYLLAQEGYQPLVIERGDRIEERTKKVEDFWNNGNLDIHSNVQFGEGGAGTFSDGKLNTLVKDKNYRMKKVFEIFVENGSPKEIMYEHKPHIGTDILRKVVINMRKKIIKFGGSFYYRTCLTNIFYENKILKAIEVNHQEIINCDVLILAIGHSARDTFEMLYNKKIEMISKPFAIGIRIQHPQEMINEAQYGEKSKYLPPASYKLTYKASNGRGVYSFCMCPGGYVVNASSEEGLLAINGMSNHKRDSNNANSAIVVTVSNNDFGNHPLDGMKYQRTLEIKAHQLGNSNIPIQLLKDFNQNKISTGFQKIHPIMKGNYTFSNLNNLFSKEICDSLKEAIEYFGTKIKGYNREDAILAAIESRTSSPIRIIRNEDYESNILGIYPCGEGAGYAGGITTSAMDGMKIAETIIQKYIDNFSNKK